MSLKMSCLIGKFSLFRKKLARFLKEVYYIH